MAPLTFLHRQPARAEAWQPLHPFPGMDGLDGLDVLPYLPHSTPFAALAAHLLSTRSYQRVLIDWPAPLQQVALDAALVMLPHPGCLAFAAPEGGWRAFAFGPVHAPVVAARWARRAGIPVQCVDDRDMLAYPRVGLWEPVVPPLKDPAQTLHLGLQRTLAPLWRAAATQRQSMPEAAGPYQAQRYRRMAEAVRNAMAPGHRALLVVDARRWPTLAAALQAPLAEPDCHALPARVPRRRARLLLVGWRQAYQAGLLCTAPALAAAFWQHLFPGTVRQQAPVWMGSNVVALPRRVERLVVAAGTPAQRQPFDPLVWLDRLLVEELLGSGAVGVARADPSTSDSTVAAPSAAAIENFRTYLQRLQVSARQALPAMGSVLLHASVATLGSGAASRMAAALMVYPDDLPLPQADSTQALDAADLVAADSGRPLLAPAHESLGPGVADEREALAQHALMADLGEALRATCGEASGGIRFTVRQDYRRLALASQTLRSHVARQCGTQAARSNGSIEAGLDLRATLGAMARGERHLYVRRTSHSFRPARLGVFTPIVFLFDLAAIEGASNRYSVVDMSAATKRRALGLPAVATDELAVCDQVITLSVVASAGQVLGGGHISWDRLQAMGLLCTSQRMGVERYRLVTQRPAHLQCRVSPCGAATPSDLSTAERLVAWAAVFVGAGPVIVCAPAAWAPSAPLQVWLRTRRTPLMRVPLTRLPPEQVAALQRLTFTSGALRRVPESQRQALLEAAGLGR